MNRLIILFTLSGSLFLISCSNTPKAESEVTEQSLDLPDDFLDFLDEFHSDVDFQKAHIQWPLQGLPTLMNGSDTTLVEDAYRWTKEDWIMHQDFNENNDEFEQQYSMFGDDMIIEHILHINGTMGMERRFSKRDDTWNLIYYAGMNLIKK